jgi:phosphoglycolate phosphatase
MRIDGVIFDYDGTLAHLNIDFGAMRRDVEDLIQTYDIRLSSLHGPYVLEMIQEVRKQLAHISEEAGNAFHQTAVQLVTRREITAAGDGRLMPGVRAMLTTLRRRGIGVGIITRNCDEAVRITFPNIDQYCDAFIPRDSVVRVKPHPDQVALAMRTMRIRDPSRCLMVGDHVLDIETGKRMGMKTAGVLTGNTTRQMFEHARADVVLSTAVDIPTYVFDSEHVQDLSG